MASILKEFEHLKIKLVDIKSATDDFSKNKVIGVGGFGKVYLGEVSSSEGKIMCAFKRLDRQFGQGDSEFWKEILMLSDYKHENLICLRGFCDEGPERILVYEYASNGSLDRYLGSTHLTWRQRIKICVDAARGLSYLHDDKGTTHRVLHRDVKSANILLDDCWNGKVSDMGLSKTGPANQDRTYLITQVVGTPGYCDPLYMYTYTLTKESDVYSFGVVLCEVLCGRLCYSNGGVLVHSWKEAYKQKKLHEIVFQGLARPMDSNSLEIFSGIAFQCLGEHREDRPTMPHVVEKLESALHCEVVAEQLEIERQEKLEIERQEKLEIERQKKLEIERQEKLEIERQKKLEIELQEKLEMEQLDKEREEKMKIELAKNYEQALKDAVSSLKYRSSEVVKILLSRGVFFNSGQTWFSLDDNGKHCEMISITTCLDPVTYKERNCTEYLRKFCKSDDSRFTSDTYITTPWSFKTRVRSQFLSPLVTYRLYIVFREIYNNNRNESTQHFVRFTYKIEGEENKTIVQLGEGRWLMAELCRFSSDVSTVDINITFDTPKSIEMEGFMFQPLENVDVEVEYQQILEATSYPLIYRSSEELRVLLAKGVSLNKGKTWFSINDNGEHCEMISIAECLVAPEHPEIRNRKLGKSRFAVGCVPMDWNFEICVTPEFLTPQIAYTVNLVFKLKRDMVIYYKLKEETRWRCRFLYHEREDGWLMAELCEYTSDGEAVEIVFQVHEIAETKIPYYNGRSYEKEYIYLEGIEFQPLALEKVEVREDEKVDNIVAVSDADALWERNFPVDYYEDIIKLSKDCAEWTTTKELFCILRNGFPVSDGQQWLFLDQNGKKCLMLSATSFKFEHSTKKSLSESRFREAVIADGWDFSVVNHIDSHFVSPQTQYACYLIYKLPEDLTEFKNPMMVFKEIFYQSKRTFLWYFSLVVPQNPIIRPRGNQHARDITKRSVRIPQYRTDGWMEVQISEFATGTSDWVHMVGNMDNANMHLRMKKGSGDSPGLRGLLLQGIEFRPI